MGIPKFGKWFITTFPKSRIEEDKCKVDILCIDANAMMHTVASHVYAYHVNSTIEQKEKVIRNTPEQNMRNFFYSLINRINKLANQTNASNVWFFVDGSVCFAKMIQQRARRFQSQKIMYKDQVLFNTADISPGTEFMIKFDEEFLEYVKRTRDRNYELQYSNYRNPGEGEHKFLDYIRKKMVTNKKIAFVGLDADLFMLGSITHTYNNHVYLFRDNVYIDLSTVWIEQNFTATNIYDWVYTFFMIGNDFVPKMIYFYELDNNLTILYNTFKTFISRNKSVRVDFLEFLQELQKKENLLITNFYKYMKSINANQYDKLNAITTQIPVISTSGHFIKNEYKIEPKELRNIVYANAINVEKTAFRFIKKFCDDKNLDINVYTQSSYGENIANEPTPVQVLSNIIDNFCKAMDWTYLYYMYGNVDYTWYSKFMYAPMISELISNYENCKVLNFQNMQIEETTEYLRPQKNATLIDEDKVFYREKRFTVPIDIQLRIIMPPTYSKNIDSYGPYDIIKDVNFFENDPAGHNFITTTTLYPVEVEEKMMPYGQPLIPYITPNVKKIKSILPAPTTAYSAFVKQSSQPQDIVRPIMKDELNTLFTLFISKLKNKNISLNRNYLNEKVYNAKQITTTNNLQMYIEPGYYVFVSTNNNCLIDYDEFSHELRKDIFAILHVKKYLSFLTNNVIVKMFPVIVK